MLSNDELIHRNGWYLHSRSCFHFVCISQSLGLITEEIEDPFSGDANNVPSDKIAATIQHNIAELLLVNIVTLKMKNAPPLQNGFTYF